MFLRSPACQQSVFQRYHSEKKHFSEFNHKMVEKPVEITSKCHPNIKSFSYSINDIRTSAWEILISIKSYSLSQTTGLFHSRFNFAKR